MFGFHGRYLKIDLLTGAATFISLPEPILRRFLGGVGLATYLLHREAPPRVPALAPDSPLVFSLSPLVGTPLTTSAKFAVANGSGACSNITSGSLPEQVNERSVASAITIHESAPPIVWHSRWKSSGNPRES